MKKVVEMTKDYLDEINAKPGEYSFCIGYGYDYEEAVKFREMLKDLVKERLGIEEIEIHQIGATIGVHTGPKQSRQKKFHNSLSQDSCPENIYDTGQLFFHIFRDIFYLYASNLCKKK